MSSGVTFFKVDPALDDVWASYLDKNEERLFFKYVSDLVRQWERQVAPSWEELVAARLRGRREEGPPLSELPDELLVACSKFLFIARDEAEQGEVNRKSVSHAKDIVKCLTILCRCDATLTYCTLSKLSNKPCTGFVITFLWCLQWTSSPW